MSRVEILQNATAISKGNTTPFSARGGTAPYSLSVLPGGIGGTIDAQGLYTSPQVLGEDIIQAEDSLGAKGEAKICTMSPVELFCEIIQREMELATGQVYLWDQKFDIPNDGRLYVAVAELSPRPFANTNKFDQIGVENQSVNFLSTLSVDIMSRGPDARERKGEVILALGSTYAQSQMELNSFNIGGLSTGFNNLSEVDGAAIPYRYNISVLMQYFVTKNKPVAYYDSFESEVEVNP